MTGRDLLRWWRAPLWVAALATGAKSFADNPVIGSQRLNRRGLHLRRVELAHRLAWLRRRRLAPSVPADLRGRFDRDGFVCIPDFLPRDVFDRLARQLLHGSFETRGHRQGDTLTRRVPVGPEMLRAFPDLRRLLDDPAWKGLLAYVASTKSRPLYYLQTIAGSVAEGPPDPQVQLHSDTFHPSLKAWLFLTDVPDEDRPLTYVAGSHRVTPQRRAWEHARSCSVASGGDRLSQRGSFRVHPDELADLALPGPTRFAVPANTLVAVDTYGFHARGHSDHPTIRVELWAFSRRTPFLPWAGFDLLGLPFIAERRAEWLARIVDRLDRSGWKKQQWHSLGQRRPLDPE